MQDGGINKIHLQAISSYFFIGPWWTEQSQTFLPTGLPPLKWLLWFSTVILIHVKNKVKSFWTRILFGKLKIEKILQNWIRVVCRPFSKWIKMRRPNFIFKRQNSNCVYSWINYLHPVSHVTSHVNLSRNIWQFHFPHCLFSPHFTSKSGGPQLSWFRDNTFSVFPTTSRRFRTLASSEIIRLGKVNSRFLTKDPRTFLMKLLTFFVEKLVFYKKKIRFPRTRISNSNLKNFSLTLIWNSNKHPPNIFHFFFQILQKISPNFFFWLK